MKKRSETNASSLHLWKQIRIVRGTDDEKTRVYVLKKSTFRKRLSAIGWSLVVTKVSKIVNKQFYRGIFRETMIFSTRIFMKNCYLKQKTS